MHVTDKYLTISDCITISMIIGNMNQVLMQHGMISCRKRNTTNFVCLGQRLEVVASRATVCSYFPGCFNVQKFTPVVWFRGYRINHGTLEFLD